MKNVQPLNVILSSGDHNAEVNSKEWRRFEDQVKIPHKGVNVNSFT